MKISERTCCVCRSKREKRLLARIVSVDDALVWDVHQNLPGRGGYVHLTPECVLKMGEPARWERVLKISSGTLRREQVAGVVRQLMSEVEALSTEERAIESSDSVKRGGAAKKVRL